MIHHVFANKSNAGDWLSALGIQALLAPCPVVEHLCDAPFVPHTIAALSRLTERDLVVIGGGGLFMDYFLPFWEAFRPLARHIPFCIWGAGYCDLKQEPTRPPRELLMEIIRNSRLAVVRDELSRRHLAEASLPPPVPCPSLCAVPHDVGRGHGLLHVDNYTTAGAAVYEAMDAFGRQFARETGRPYRQTNNRITAGSLAELNALLAMYASTDIVLSSALHGCVIGMAMGRKVLAVSGDYKLESFMEAAGQRDWVCGQEQVDLVPSRLAEISQQSSQAAFVADARQANRRIARCVIRLAGISSQSPD